MTRPHIMTFTAAVLGVAASAPLAAHHSFFAVFDGDKTVTVEGVVTEFRLVNPHAQLTLDVTDETGALRKWTVEFDGRLNLTTKGWTESTIAVGERVKITGNPERTGAPAMFFQKLVHADDSELLRPAVERFNAIEEERRQRARERTPQDSR